MRIREVIPKNTYSHDGKMLVRRIFRVFGVNGPQAVERILDLEPGFVRHELKFMKNVPDRLFKDVQRVCAVRQQEMDDGVAREERKKMYLGWGQTR